MKVHQITNLIFFVMLLSVVGCYYDVEEEIYPTLECDTLDMSYETDIQPLIEENCYGCHSAAANFGNVNLEGHPQVLQYVTDESLLGAIKHDPGFSPMPKNLSKLLECEIEKIESWISDGALNN